MDGERGIADGQENEELFNNLGAVGGSDLQKNNLDWQPNSDLLKQLIDFGIGEDVAKNALFITENKSIESAINWIFDNPSNEDVSLENRIQKWTINEPNKNYLNTNTDFKMTFIVNSSLNMGLGKTCAQVAHAALGLFRILIQKEEKYSSYLIKWFDDGETKIVLKADSTKDLIELEKNALSKGLNTYLVTDAGKTQVLSGSITVLSIFGCVNDVNLVTAKLKLLK